MVAFDDSTPFILGIYNFIYLLATEVSTDFEFCYWIEKFLIRLKKLCFKPTVHTTLRCV